MKKNVINHAKKMVMILVLSFCLVNLVSALDVEIDIKDSFSTGERMEFDYTLISNESLQVSFIPHIECKQVPIKLFMEKTEQLQPDIHYTDTYSGQIIKESFEPQTCTAYIKITDPVKKTVSRNFSIVTDPSFDFSVELDKKVFPQGEEINIGYTSSVSNPEINATLVYPDGSEEKINLPISIKASQIGTYELEIEVSKEGYKSIERSIEFGVIEKDIKIKNQSDDTTEKGAEDKKDKTKIEKWIPYIIGGLIILVLIIIFFLLKNMKKRRRKKGRKRNK